MVKAVIRVLRFAVCVLRFASSPHMFCFFLEQESGCGRKQNSNKKRSDQFQRKHCLFFRIVHFYFRTGPFPPDFNPCLPVFASVFAGVERLANTGKYGSKSGDFSQKMGVKTARHFS